MISCVFDFGTPDHIVWAMPSVPPPRPTLYMKNTVDGWIGSDHKP